MINNKEKLQQKRKATPQGLYPKSVVQIREEIEQKLGTSNQEIEDQLYNLKAGKEIDKLIEQTAGNRDEGNTSLPGDLTQRELATIRHLAKVYGVTNVAEGKLIAFVREMKTLLISQHKQ